jgi:hypothetical protein
MAITVPDPDMTSGHELQLGLILPAVNAADIARPLL